jgi:formylmethanofuran dehydrogenase subunit A
MSLYDLAILTRANPAKTTGIVHRKGSLGIGADGDVTVYDIDPTKLDVNNYEELIQKFSRAAYTIKDGEIAVKDGEIVAIPNQRTYYSDIKCDNDAEKAMLEDVKDWFRYYSIGFNHYPTSERYLNNPTPIQVNPEQ